MSGSGGMQIDLKVKGSSVRKWEKAFANMNKRKMSSAISKEVGSIAKLMETHAKKIVPVKTGKLRASISARKLGTLASGNVRWTLVATAPYASDVEYGTGRQRSQPYLRPAYRMYQAQMTTRLGRAIKDQWKKSVR